MALLEVTLPPGYVADAAALYRQLRYTRSLLRRIELTPSGNKATLYLSGSDTLETSGHRCYSVQATGARAASAAQHVTLYDYYAPDVEYTQMYLIPEDCPAPISHDTEDYNPTDNLFTKAKSLGDDGDIIITHEFSFEDIPEGVPLDDPMYENLTQKKDDNKNIGDNNRFKVVNNETQNDKTTLNKVDYQGNGTDKSQDDSEQTIQNAVVKEINITNAAETIKFANYSDNEIHAVNFNKSAILTQQTETKDKSNLIQNDDGIKNLNDLKMDDDRIKPNTKGDLKMSDEISVTEKYTVKNKEEAVERVTEKLKVSNPKLSEFHIIDSEKDLEVPSGVEGPMLTVVLPPKNFVYVPPDTDRAPSYNSDPEVSRRKFHVPMYGEPFFRVHDDYRNIYLR